MGSVKYLEHTLGISKSLFVGQETLTIEGRILATWQTLEAIVVSVSYDVFLPIANAHEQMQKLVQLCYAPIFEATPEGDVEELRKKNAEYGESWCRRGGIGAFFMLSRKADRLEAQLKKYGTLEKAIAESKHSTENILDTVGDLRRYLLLVLSWHELKDKEREVEPIALPAVPTAENIEDLGTLIEEQFRKQLCLECQHNEMTHMANGGPCKSSGCPCVTYRRAG